MKPQTYGNSWYVWEGPDETNAELTIATNIKLSIQDYAKTHEVAAGTILCARDGDNVRLFKIGTGAMCVAEKMEE